MCRIIGIVNNKPVQNLEGLIVTMRDSMAHGGPDDAGLYINSEKTVALGHRRLSIIDLSYLGHQPMGSEDENIWVIYNGEAYNFLELKAELKDSGYTFKSNTDTEVILKAYHAWGERTFERFNGMFAFCIYDKRRDLFYLARDHAGIKPLYYSFKNGNLTFASEVRAFRTLYKDWEATPEWRIFFLIFGHVPEPYTTLKDVYMLPKGSFLRLNLKTGDYEIKRFIEIDFTEGIKDEKEAIELVRNEFTRAVERHLISDAPIGVFLSGGIDSSLITLIAHRFQGDNLRTLSVIFNEKDYSEEIYQNIVLNKLNKPNRPDKLTHHSYLVTEKDFIENLDNIFQAMDQPTIDGVNTYFISKYAKEDGLKTVLSGLGGDELFGGYPSFQLIDKLWFYKPYSLNILNFFNEASQTNKTNEMNQTNPVSSIMYHVSRIHNLFGYLPHNKLKKLSFLSLPSPLSYYLLFRSLFTIRETARLLDITEKEVFSSFSHLLNFSSSQHFHLPPSGKNFVTALETNLYMQNQLLKDTDFMSMWHSLETRVPFLDRDLMGLTFSIKEDIKFKNGVPKGLLLEAFKDILPSEIRNRKKQGFTFPFQVWIKNNLNAFTDLLPQNKEYNRITQKIREDRLHWSRFWGLVVLNNRIFSTS